MRFTLGELIDKLSIENIRIWMMHEDKETPLKKVMLANKRRVKLIGAINDWAKEEGWESDKSY